MSFVHLLIALFFVSYSFARDELCAGVVIHDVQKLNLTDTEKRLVCGDKEVNAYKKIPAYQASFFITSFLQSRGYLRPTFEIIDQTLHVHVGKLIKLKKIQIKVTGIDHDRKIIKKEIKRRYTNKTVTPDLLDSIEAETLSHFRQRGYPCAEVKSLFDVSSSAIGVDITKTKSHHFGFFEREQIKGLHENVLKRYYSFEEAEKFNERLLILTEKRMLRSEVVQGTYFLEDCSSDGDSFLMSQRFITGPPRTLRFGVGASTELGPMARVRWSNNRSGPMASILSARLQGSVRSQSLVLTTDTFFWKDHPRRSILSQFELLRESQIDYEQFLVKLGPVTTKWTNDKGGYHSTYMLGPSFEASTYHSKIKSDTRSYKTGVIEGSLNIMDHVYEFFDIHPLDGDNFNFSFGFRHPQLGFSDPSLRLDSSYVKLGRLAELGRGTIVGGFRLNAGTLIISDNVSPVGLPPNIKFYGGGSDDIRGFSLNTLPRNDGAGALTKVSLKLELRKTYFFREKMEGFTFLDGTYFGFESFSTTPELYYSPGIGLRWLSPIGMVQTYLARALTRTEDDGNLLYLGLGGTF